MAPFTPDPSQQRVLDHASGASLVRGGAGTGKTVVLRERFARLIEGGADPERTALVLRSRRERDEARAELLRRLDRALPDLVVVTIHGLAYHLVGQRFRELGLDEPPTVVGAVEQFARVRELLEGEDPSRWPAYGRLLRLRGFADEVRQLLVRAQESLVTPEDIEARATAAGATGWLEVAAFYRQYLDVLESNREVDFAGLLTQAAVAAELGEPAFDHVLVDDHQDSTLAAERLLLSIRADELTVAGDLEQHVFSFQGTSDLPLRRFEERHPGAATFELETNHRADGVRLEAWRTDHVSEEHTAVARELRRIHVEEGVAWRDLAVVVRRQGTHAEGMRRALDDARIPRISSEAGSPAAVPATRPFVVALRWLVADEDTRDNLLEPLLTSEAGRRSPASVRTLLRLVRAHGRRNREALEVLTEDAADDVAAEDLAALTELRTVLEAAEASKGSVLDAFRTLWHGLPYASELVERAEREREARIDLDAVVQLSHRVADAGSSDDPSVDGFLQTLGVAEGGPDLAIAGDEDDDAVHVLTAHAAAGRGFDTVVILDALEGNFPSLHRPEPMFDLASLDGVRPRSEINRERLADERRLFGMVCDRARRRVLITATDPHGDISAVTLTSRFVEERGIAWARVPAADGEPVSVREAVARWRRTYADPDAPPAERLAALDGLLALGEDPRRWWFQRDWTDVGAPEREELRLSYSRLDTLENCELQFVLNELGLDVSGGYQAWVGRLIHSIAERCDLGRVERTPEAFHRVIDEEWDATRFPSYAVSEAERKHAKDVLVRNWFERYSETPATATEQWFEFPLDGATIRGKIDRIGPVGDSGTRITDYKSGRADKAGKPGESLQLGIYYLAVSECEDLAQHRPVEAVELAFLGGRRHDPELVVKDWPIVEGQEEEYKTRMRERISELIERVRRLDGARNYVAQTTANCFFCKFQTLCTRYPQGSAVFPIDEEPS